MTNPSFPTSPVNGSSPPLKKTDVGPRVKLISRELADFLKHKFPPVAFVVDPWLPKRGIAMVAGYRGVGKTFFALIAAHAIAAGGNFLGFRAPKALKVLYVDGEMDPAEFQERLRAIQCAAEQNRNGDPTLAAANLRILSHFDQELGIPDLSDQDGRGRALVEEVLGDADVLVLDNLSSLCRTGIENEAASWVIMQDWLIALRRRGKTVLLVHHGGKPDENGKVKQRGTSKREDVLNTSILLQNPRSGTFTVEFTKARGFAAPAPFAVKLEFHDKCCNLTRCSADRAAEIAALSKEGLNGKEIAERLGVSPATVSRDKRKTTLVSTEAEHAEFH